MDNVSASSPHSLPHHSPGLRCLLCDSSESRPVWELSGSEIRRLWLASRRKLTEVAYGALLPTTNVNLFECLHCGFRAFNPQLAGGSLFYEELERGGYYNDFRPEFDFALNLCSSGKARKILDVGSGQGAFLNLAKKAGLQTFAVELNEQAASISAVRHRTLSKPLEEISPDDLGGEVDALTLFQVIEHVPNPIAFMTAAARLVGPGGFLVVSVPNRPGLRWLNRWDPANLPPHHVSHWRFADLLRLGAACGLRWHSQGADALVGRDIETSWLTHNVLSAAIGRRPRPGGAWLPKFVSLLYRKLGCRYYFPRWGLSIYAAFRKP